MGRGRGGGREGEGKAACAAAVGDALLFATMCLVGLPVEAQVKDGSVYSGVFHTAYVGEGYGIVLKKARKIRDGKCDANVVIGMLIDTLLIQSEDLIQVVAKDILLPGIGIHGNAEIDGIENVHESNNQLDSTDVLGREPIRQDSFNESCTSKSGQFNSKGGADVDPLVNIGENIGHASCHAPSSVNSSDEILNEKGAKPMMNDRNLGNSAAKPVKLEATKSEESTAACTSSSDVNILNRSTSVASALYISTSSSSTSGFSSSTGVNVPSRVAATNSFLKGSKLNPGAKTFLPSYATPATLTDASVLYVPSSTTLVPIVGAQAAAEVNPIGSHSYAPTKVVQYNNVVPSNQASVPYLRRIAGSLVSRQQPVSFNSQFFPFQSGATHLHPNPPAMVGQAGQLVYVHPVPQDPIQGTMPISAPFHFLNPCQANLSKPHTNTAQGIPFVVAPQGVAYALPPTPPSPVLFSHPLHVAQPIPVPGGNHIFGSKYY